MTIIIEYFDYSDVFLVKNVIKLLEYTTINGYAFEL